MFPKFKKKKQKKTVKPVWLHKSKEPAFTKKNRYRRMNMKIASNEVNFHKRNKRRKRVCDLCKQRKANETPKFTNWNNSQNR